MSVVYDHGNDTKRIQKTLTISLKNAIAFHTKRPQQPSSLVHGTTWVFMFYFVFFVLYVTQFPFSH